MNLKDRISIDRQLLKMYITDEHSVTSEFSINMKVLRSLNWISNEHDTTAEHRVGDCRFYFGPFIDNEDTGYVIQALNTQTRRFAEVRFVFDDTTNINTVRELMRQLY